MFKGRSAPFLHLWGPQPTSLGAARPNDAQWDPQHRGGDPMGSPSHCFWGPPMRVLGGSAPFLLLWGPQPTSLGAARPSDVQWDPQHRGLGAGGSNGVSEPLFLGSPTRCFWGLQPNAASLGSPNPSLWGVGPIAVSMGSPLVAAGLHAAPSPIPPPPPPGGAAAPLSAERPIEVLMGH